MDPKDDILTTPEQLPKAEGVFAEYNKRNVELTTEEKDFVISLVAILETTELPQFDMVHTTSTSNLKVQEKANAVFSQIPQEEAIPESMRGEYPINYDKETLLKAPWVNWVHGWTKVLNYMNSIRGMQQEGVEFDPLVIADIAKDLYLYTNNSDKNPFHRTDDRFLEGKYVETKMRESGTKGVNSSRHVCYQEMKYMLNIVKNKFAKNE